MIYSVDLSTEFILEIRIGVGRVFFECSKMMFSSGVWVKHDYGELF